MTSAFSGSNNQAVPAPITMAEKIAKSSQVRYVRYDADKQQLHVVFKNGREIPPPVYTYLSFPPEMWAKLQAADSIGSFLIKNVTRPIGGALPFAFNKVSCPPELLAEIELQESYQAKIQERVDRILVDDPRYHNDSEAQE